MSATNSVAVHSDYVVGFRSPIVRNTEQEASKTDDLKSADYLSRVVVRETDVRKISAQKNLLAVATDVPEPMQVALPLQKSTVDGSVIGIDDASVKCELYLERGIVAINLPKVFFPPGIEYGAPVSIAMDESDGIRKPVVTMRRINPDALEAESREIDAIVDSLE